jgi:hypothetical protein
VELDAWLGGIGGSGVSRARSSGRVEKSLLFASAPHAGTDDYPSPPSLRCHPVATGVHQADRRVYGHGGGMASVSGPGYRTTTVVLIERFTTAQNNI